MIIPQKGFYVHCKHDPHGELHNYIYEVVGIGRNTEAKTLTVLYRPMYKNEWMPPADLQSRPIDMFNGNVEVDGKTVPRFTLITDPKKIQELTASKRINFSHKDGIEICPICRRAYSERNRKVKYHLQYKPIPKFIYACQSCNHAEYLSRNWVRHLKPWQWYKIKLVKKFGREYRHLIH